MSAFDLYVELRADLLEQISGVQNSNGYFSWDNTTPNSVLKMRLDKLLEVYVKKASAFGMYRVTRYSMCSNSKHKGFPTENSYGLNIVYGGGDYIWNGEQLFQGARICRCPCSDSNKVCKNYVIDEFVYKDEGAARLGSTLFDILEDVSNAIRRAGDNRTRSGIRECLLRGLLRVNDAILPQTVEEYVSSRKR